MNDGGDEHAGEDQTIVSMDRLRLVGETCAEERSIEPVPTAIAGEHPARSIRAVGGGCEPDDQPLSLWVTEVRHGFAPILLVEESPALLTGDAFAPFHETWAMSASDDFLVEGHSAGTSTRSFGSTISTT